MNRDPNRPRRREPYHYDAEASVYLASILAILQRGQSIPVRVLQIVWAGWKLEKMNRKNGKPPCVLRTHKAARAGRRIAILMSPRLHYITTEIRMEGKL